MTDQTAVREAAPERKLLLRILDLMSMPALAILTAFFLGALLILFTSGSFTTLAEAYWGLVRGAFFKIRGFSKSLVATIPYILLSLGLAVGFKSGLFNIGVEGQYTIGAICAAWAGSVLSGLPTIIHLPLALGAGALGGAFWAAIPAYLKVRTGAHEVISTMMMNYVAFRMVEYFNQRAAEGSPGKHTANPAYIFGSRTVDVGSRAGTLERPFECAGGGAGSLAGGGGYSPCDHRP